MKRQYWKWELTSAYGNLSEIWINDGHWRLLVGCDNIVNKPTKVTYTENIFKLSSYRNVVWREISEEDAQQFKTFGDVVAYIDHKVAEKK